MKHSYAVSAVSAWLFAACANLHGGQSGDDGDVIDRGGQPPTADPDPTGPEQDECSKARELHATTPSALGKTPTELIAELKPTALPLHWVAYAGSNFDVGYHPGVSQSTLALSLALRTPHSKADDQDKLIELTPDSTSEVTPPCAVPRVRAPIWLVLTSADGAFDEKLPGTAVLYGNSIAEVSASLPYDDVQGTFRFERAASHTPTQTWAPSHLVVRADLWPGGSAGSIYPEFVPTQAPDDKGDDPEAQPPPPLPSELTVTSAPIIPERWDAVAVWPRQEQCTPGVARSPTDAVVGVSAQSVVDELSAHASLSLTITDNRTTLATSRLMGEIALTELPQLLCVLVDAQQQTLEFSLPASVHATPVDETHGEVDANLGLSLTAQTNNQSLTALRFRRALDETAAPASRSELEQATGVSLDGIEAEYSQFWWTWYGHLTPATATAAWQQETHLVITSPNTEETALTAEQAKEGGPGFGVSYGDQGVQLPGDVLFHAIEVKSD